jgi:hypothetical protein
MTDSSNDPASIAADEVRFRTSVLVQLGKIDVTLSRVDKTLDEHIKHDNERFGAVTQKIGDNSSSISKGAGIVACVVVMLGVVMWIIERLIR